MLPVLPSLSFSTWSLLPGCAETFPWISRQRFQEPTWTQQPRRFCQRRYFVYFVYVFYSSHLSYYSKGVRLKICKFLVSNLKFQVLEMYNMLLEISTELDSIKAMLQKSECTHLLEFQIFAKKEMRSQIYYLSFNLTLSYCYELKVSR